MDGDVEMTIEQQSIKQLSLSLLEATVKIKERDDKIAALEEAKAELVDVINALIDYRGILTSGNEAVIKAKELIEKHKLS
jgi:hypothetical protein